MDEKTEELRDLFIETTGSETVTEAQEESRGSLAVEAEDVDERVGELVAAMRERYDFATSLDDDALCRVVHGFYADESDADLAAALDVTEESVFEARMDLHLVRESDRDAPFAFADLRAALVEGQSIEACAEALDADEATVRHYARVIEAEREARRANDRFRDEFTELLTDSDLSRRLAHDAREDGLKEATEDMEVDVSF